VDRLPALAAGPGGELELRAGRLAAAGERFEHAYALACQLGDPCWEGMAAPGLGLLRATVGDHAKAKAKATAWRRWPRAAACASWWSAPTSTAATSATRPPWPPRLLAGSIDNPALARLLDRGPG